MHVTTWFISVLTIAQAINAASPVGVGSRPANPTLARTIILEGVRGTSDTSGIAGRIDHLAYDPATQRLFVAALGNSTLEVLDLDKGQRVKSIANLKKPQGIAVVAATGLAVVACGGDNTVHAFDTQTLKEKATATAGENADNIRYDARAGRLYTGCGKESPGSFMVYDARTLNKTGEVLLPKRPESFQLDPAGSRIFANMPGPKRADTNGFVIAVDRNTGKTVWTTTLERTARNFPMAYDAAHDRLFIACRKPAKIMALDAKTGKVISEAACVADSDDLFYDAKTGRIIVIGGGTRPDAASTSRPATGGEDAAIDVFEVDEHAKLTKIGSVRTARFARTGLFVPDRRAVYLAVPPLDGRDAEIREYKVSD